MISQLKQNFSIIQVLYKTAESPINTFFLEQDVAGLVGAKTAKLSTVFNKIILSILGS